jgi:hypothetical protein
MRVKAKSSERGLEHELNEMRAERDCRDYVCTLQHNAEKRSAVSEL